ncbi:MAG: hypothetical protein IIA44_04920 [Acidobacteria bacterium]|nr:hypothetical protein [Acidobacteriota bacterium]
MLGRVGGMWVRVIVIAGVMVTAGCTFGSTETTTTTTQPVTTTLPPETTTSTTATTLAPLSAPRFPSYRIVSRIDDANGGDTVVVLLDSGSVEVLTDIDLYDVVGDVVDKFPPIFEAHVVDSLAAADAVLLEEPTDEQLQELAEHYLVSLEEGFRIVYRGPFAELGTTVLGS